MTRNIFALLLLSLTITACDSGLTEDGSNANNNIKTSASTPVSPSPVATTPEVSTPAQQQFKAGDKVRVTINGSSADATVVRVDEKIGKVTVKLEGQTEEKTVAISDVTNRPLPH